MTIKMGFAVGIHRRVLKMRQILIPAVAAGLYLASSACLAYEPATHQLMANTSTLLSVLGTDTGHGTTTILQDVGLAPYDDTKQLFPIPDPTSQFSSGYSVWLDPAHSIPYPIDPQNPPTKLDIQNLINAGAALEDGDNRAMCHFFDPINDAPLNQDLIIIPTIATPLGNLPLSQYTFDAGNFASNFSAQDWALDQSPVETDSCIFSGVYKGVSISLVSDTTQDTSLTRVNDDFFNALTLPAKSDRERNFQDLFLTLGHGLHLLEDMAQPQHVRDDMHCDEPTCQWAGLYLPSRYEAYVYYHWYNYTSDLKPELPTLASYWSTGADGSDARQGIADFTNLNFVSSGTLDGFDGTKPNAKYTSPVWDGNIAFKAYTDVYAYKQANGVPPEVGTQCNTTTPCFVGVYESVVTDNYAQTSAPNPYAATGSLFDIDTAKLGIARTYFLNDANYQAAEDILVPEAIGYGVGLIDHIFRGKLDVQWDSQDPGETNFQVINLSDGAINGGELTAYYDGTDGQRHDAGATVNASPILLSKYCTPAFLCGNNVQVSISPSLSPPSAEPNEYTFVFKGPLGGDQDTHIAGKVFKPNDNYMLMVDDYTDGPNVGPLDALVVYDANNDNLGGVGSPPAGLACDDDANYNNPDSTYTLAEDCFQQIWGIMFNTGGYGITDLYQLRNGWGVHLYQSAGTFTVNGRPTINWSNDYDLITYIHNPATPFGDPQGQYQDCFAGFSAMAMDNINIFLLVNRGANSVLTGQTNQPCPYGPKGIYLDIFDHSGNFQTMTHLSEFDGDASDNYSITSMSANNSSMCITSQDLSPNGSGGNTTTYSAELRNLDGSGSGNALDKQGSPLRCAATSDRFYVLDINGGVQTLIAYDFTGAVKGTRELTEIEGAHLVADQVAVVSNSVYVLTKGAPTTVYQYRRTISGGGDTFAPATVSIEDPTPKTPFVVPTTGDSGAAGMTVDMYEAINLAPPQ